MCFSTLDTILIRKNERTLDYNEFIADYRVRYKIKKEQQKLAKESEVISIEKYKLEIPENAKVSILPTENKKLTILSENLVDKFISDVSDFDIDKVAKEIEENPEKWTTFRPLKIV